MPDTGCRIPDPTGNRLSFAKASAGEATSNWQAISLDTDLNLLVAKRLCIGIDNRIL
jgi:hypothetical protein